MYLFCRRQTLPLHSRRTARAARASAAAQLGAEPQEEEGRPRRPARHRAQCRWPRASARSYARSSARRALRRPPVPTGRVGARARTREIGTGAVARDAHLRLSRTRGLLTARPYSSEQSAKLFIRSRAQVSVPPSIFLLIFSYYCLLTVYQAVVFVVYSSPSRLHRMNLISINNQKWSLISIIFSLCYNLSFDLL